MKELNNYKQSLLIATLLIISWWGALDSLASRVNGESIQNAAVIYGVARSINGVISLIQSAEIGAIVGSVHPGELLDPMNDLIERFSSVMTWSLSSLVLQKILLTIFSSLSFKVVFTMLCLVVILSNKITKSRKFINGLWMAFIIAASLRFSIAVVCGLTAVLDYSFLQKIQDTSLKTVQTFNSEISAGIKEIAFLEADINQEVDSLAVLQTQVIDQMIAAKEDLKNLEEKLIEEPKPAIWEWRKNKSSERLALEIKREEKELEISEFETELEKIASRIECAELKISGKSCKSSWSKLKTMFSPNKISQISQEINQTINDFITVLVSLVLTTIILPLFFLYTYYRFFKFSVATLGDQNWFFPNQTINQKISNESRET